MPPYIKLCHETIRHHCGEDFEIILVTPKTIDNYVSGAQEYKRISVPNPAVRTAAIRVALLAEHGGIWMDSDIIVMKSFAPMKKLIEQHGFVGILKNSEDDNHVMNGMMMSEPGGKVITEYRRRIDDVVSKCKRPTWGELGARMLTPLINDFAGPEDYILLDEKLISPIPWQGARTFFSALPSIEEFVVSQTYSVMLFNHTFNRLHGNLKLTSREGVLGSDMFLAKLFKHSLGI